MPGLSLDELTEYTDWERGRWRAWFREHGDAALQLSAGPHGDGRFQNSGELVRHIFSAEKRYVERVLGEPLTDAATIPCDRVDGLFEFGQRSRGELKQLIASFPADQWESERDFNILNFLVTATPRKVIVHTLMHEIRHWAQIATLFRLSGMKTEPHDLIGSPVMGGAFQIAG